MPGGPAKQRPGVVVVHWQHLLCHTAGKSTHESRHALFACVGGIDDEAR
jgi:hypothetical protein